MTRAFVAVRPPDAVLDAVDTLRVDTGRPTTRAQWHITLQFLGNRADIDAVGAALAGIEVRAATARLGGLGAFPSARRARVVWLGLARGGELFSALAAAVGERLAPLGHEPESRPYHAHLTLARLKASSDVREALEAAAAPVVGEPWLVDEVIVYESRLRRAGAEYEPRVRVALRPT